jgi:hypothetical protein
VSGESKMDIYFYVNLILLLAFLWPAWKYLKELKHDIALVVIYIVSIIVWVIYPQTFLGAMTAILLVIGVWFLEKNPGLWLPELESKESVFVFWTANLIYLVGLGPVTYSKLPLALFSGYLLFFTPKTYFKH